MVAPTQSVFAHGGGGDIAVFQTGGQVDVGFAILDDDDIEQIAFDASDSVFQAVLVPLVANPIIPYDLSSTEPGYDANEGALPELAEIRWNLLELTYWDGAGSPDFVPATGVEGGYAPQPYITGADGGFHKHEDFGLEDLTDDGQPIADGVYLAELTLSIDGLADSDAFYVVALVDDLVNSNADPVMLAEDIGAAVRDYMSGTTTDAPVLENKDFTFYADAIRHAESLAVPEPTALVLALGLAVLAPCRLR